MLFLIYAPLYSAGRFLFSFIRGDEAAVLGPLHQAHVVSLIIIAVCVPLLIWIAKKPAPQPSTELAASSDKTTDEPKADSS
jgi:prolipoprotein diacylglyceryltransferase